MSVANRPHFDIQIGQTRFSRTPLVSGGDGTLLSLVQSIIINKNMDKTLTKGKRRVKMNTCDIVLLNVDKQLDNVLRLGRKVQVWLGYASEPMVRVGVYVLSNPKWVYPRNGVPKIHIKAKAGDVGLRGDNSGKVYRNMSPTQIVEKIVKDAGYNIEIKHVTEKQDYFKTVDEEPDDLIHRLAYDLGYEYYVNDETDPNTVVFRPVNDTEFTVIGGRQFTTGWGPGTEANYPAAQMEIEHNYPDPVVSAMTRTESGQGAIISGQASAILIRLQKEGQITGETVDKVKRTLSTGTSSIAGLANKTNSANAAQQLTKTLTCMYDPGIPYFRLGQLIRVVGHGDNSRTFRLVDITHTVNTKGFTTQIKAAIGGNPAGNPATVGPRQAGLLAGATSVIKVEVAQTPTSGKAEAQ